MKKKKHKFYSEEFKWKVVQEVLKGEITKEEARRVYGIRSNCAVLYWMRAFSGQANYRQGGLPLGKTNEMQKQKDSGAKDKLIAQLKEELRRECLRADLWQKMVEAAEEELELDIRKKYGAGQSRSSKQNKGK